MAHILRNRGKESINRICVHDSDQIKNTKPFKIAFYLVTGRKVTPATMQDAAVNN